MKKSAEEFVKYRMTESMTVHRDHDGPSRGPSTRTHFDRFIRFFINSSKNLVFGVRLFDNRLFLSRLFDIRLFGC